MRKTAIFYLLSFICLAACQTKHRGYVFPDDIDAQAAGVKTVAGLEEKFGSPQGQTLYGREKILMYYGADENYNGPFPHSFSNKTALFAWADGAGRITKTRVLHDGDFAGIGLDGDETPIPAAVELNALQELMNNVGRFSPAGLGQ
ncbi:MAG: hypothetical protein LBO08_01775 [Rickettsiales bacterium]|jgi:hypothetical protein|nr:hypothetical protein [Rickettsiales bacterium]